MDVPVRSRMLFDGILFLVVLAGIIVTISLFSALPL